MNKYPYHDDHYGPVSQPTHESTDNDPKVAILLCTFNGENFLRDQINSIVSQTHKNWVLYVSDDGSTDATMSILMTHAKLIEQHKITIFAGPQMGFASNFVSLINRSEIQADYFAFCDQDDIWFEDKLERSIDKLHMAPTTKAALYCSRTRLVNTEGSIIGYSPIFRNTPSFSNALVQSLAGANTMLINSTARELLRKNYGSMDIVAHDWLVYLMVSGSEGFICYDPNPTLDYRQHDRNLIGANSGFVSRALRMRKMFSGRFRAWGTSNVLLLNTFRHELTQRNRDRLDKFEIARHSGLIRRIILMSEINIYRQTFYGNLALIVGILFNKI